ncbi:conjugal transfer TraA domain protein [Orientia tsutsugamushi str. TA716]|uniref:Conjugal transfer TraA domain protein n=1 Tax=Orientia tsutsugamushi str. TA716 TaxID=1359175 RepID=A0A0F3P7B1_ORITS|nr:conjugal transfer TraA domain protein [Orientia tsutsugamushi str. TA716]
MKLQIIYNYTLPLVCLLLTTFHIFSYPKLSFQILMNEVERTEKRRNSKLLKDIVIALPDDKELNLEERIKITHEIVDAIGCKMVLEYR